MKRGFDIIITICLIATIWPILLIVALLVRLKLGSPVLFQQERPAQDGRIFRLHKFRTMTNRKDSNGQLLADEQRLTSFGKLLRSTSLDELPELWNILKGDMSLVGPRPLLISYLDRYTPEQIRRHEVRPGLTGWAQVNGRNATTWEDRLKQDVWYVDNRNFLLDIKILWLTLGLIFKRSGISQEGHATMPEFSPPDRSKSGSENTSE